MFDLAVDRERRQRDARICDTRAGSRVLALGARGSARGEHGAAPESHCGCVFPSDRMDTADISPTDETSDSVADVIHVLVGDRIRGLVPVRRETSGGVHSIARKYAPAMGLRGALRELNLSRRVQERARGHFAESTAPPPSPIAGAYFRAIEWTPPDGLADGRDLGFGRRRGHGSRRRPNPRSRPSARHPAVSIQSLGNTHPQWDSGAAPCIRELNLSRRVQERASLRGCHISLRLSAPLAESRAAPDRMPGGSSPRSGPLVGVRLGISLITSVGGRLVNLNASMSALSKALAADISSS